MLPPKNGLIAADLVDGSIIGPVVGDDQLSVGMSARVVIGYIWKLFPISEYSRGF